MSGQEALAAPTWVLAAGVTEAEGVWRFCSKSLLAGETSGSA